MPSALVTGATGMLGAHIVDRLLSDGWSARAMVRDPARAGWLRAQGASLHTADLLDSVAFTAAARGCDVVFHAAAAITPGSGGWDAYRLPNVEGTRNAIRAAALSGARLLHVSSVAVYGPDARYSGTHPVDTPSPQRTPGPLAEHPSPRRKPVTPAKAGAPRRKPGHPRESPSPPRKPVTPPKARHPGESRGTTEDTPLAPLHERLWYARSKRESEAMVLAAHDREELWSTAIRPSVIYGERDRQFVPRVARLLRLGVLPLPENGRSTLAVVHAANVADAAILAATSDIAGGRVYNVAGDFDVSVATFMKLGAQGMGRRLRIVPVPETLARAGIAVARGTLRLAGAGGLAAMLDGTLDFVLRDNPFDSGRARRELGWTPRVTPDVGVPDAFRWAAARRSG